MSALPWGVPLTYDDLRRTPDDGHRYELVDGTLVVTPAPNTRHQRALRQLVLLLGPAVGAEQELYFAPTDLIVSDATVLEPDLIVAERRNLSERGVEGTAQLCAEVLSPSTRLYDLHTKWAKYAEAGVGRYWIVDPDVPSLTVLRLEGGAYVEEAHVEGTMPYAATWPVAVTVAPADLVAD